MKNKNSKKIFCVCPTRGVASQTLQSVLKLFLIYFFSSFVSFFLKRPRRLMITFFSPQQEECFGNADENLLVLQKVSFSKFQRLQKIDIFACNLLKRIMAFFSYKSEKLIQKRQTPGSKLQPQYPLYIFVS